MTHQRIAEHIEIDWLDRQSPATACPCCAYTGPVRQYIDIDYQPPEARHRFILQICPSCSVRFVDNTHTMDYATETLIAIGWDVYQIQLGAGVWPISAPLTRVDKPAGSRVLEIGGAYGFGLDFCIRARGWTGEGFDPSPLAAFGARELDLTVSQDYFEDKDVARGPYDVVIATEVIEHLERPPEFLSLMRRALADDGILVLSTPDAAWITPALPAAQMMPLLSPGAHIVLQTAESLEKALKAAGFTDVKIKCGGLSLVAYASASPFSLNEDEAAGRAAYRRYLVERSRLTSELSDLRLGFAGRGYFEACNDGDTQAAEAAWAALLPAAQARFGLNLETLAALPAEAADTSLARLGEIMPLGLGMILFSRAMYLLGRDAGRAEILPLFILARDAAAALLNALGKRSLTDGLTASLAGLIEQEIILCRAEAAEPDSLPALIAMAVGQEGGALVWRGFTGYVNAGALDLAARLKTSLGLDLPAHTLPDDLRRDGLLSLANLALAPGGDTQAAFVYAKELCALADERSASAVILQAFTRLVNASDYEAAWAAASAYNVTALAEAARDEVSGQDAKLAGVMLDLAAGDPAAVPDRLQGLDIPAAQRGKLLLEAFIRLVNASRYEEAQDFIATHDVAALAAVQEGKVADDTGLARIVLDLAVGDPAAVPARLQTVALAPGLAEKMLLEAFIRLVNGKRYEEAEAFAAAHGVQSLAMVNQEAAGQDAQAALVTILLEHGDPAAVPALLAALTLPAVLNSTLTLEAFMRLVNTARYKEALAFSATHNVPALAAQVGGEVARNTRLSEIALDLSAGDPADVPARLEGVDLPDALRGRLLLEAFIRLVNASRYAEAQAFINTHDVPALASLCEGAVVNDTGLARIVLDLAVGDPAAVPARLAGLALPVALHEKMLLEAFSRLVSAARHPEAMEYAAAHHIATLIPRAESTGQNAAIAWAVAELAAGDPAVVPARLAGLGITPERVRDLHFGAYTGLINAARYEDAEALAGADPANFRALPEASGKAARDARLAEVMLDLQRHRMAQACAKVLQLERREGEQPLFSTLYVDGFVHLINAAQYDEARAIAANRAIERRLPACPKPLQYDARAALLMLELQPGGHAERIPQLLDEAITAGLPPPRLNTLVFAAFVTLVNAGDFATARLLRHVADPLLQKLRPPLDDAARNALFAAGMLALQDRDECRRAVILFARLRDDLVKQTPPGDEPGPLFWHAMRGEVMALHRLDRSADVTALLQSFIPAYASAPDDLRAQLGENV
jgi:SAM-dependent methyltransferase